MKFKYYLRGAGIGILLTTIIFMIAIPLHGGILTDESAINRATKLGYVLAESADAASDSEGMTIDQYIEDAKENASNASSDAASTSDNTASSESADTSGSSSAGSSDSSSDKTAADTSEDTTVFEYTFTINSSENSSDVASRLQKAGIIDDASDFDSYMVKNGYDTKLTPGTYSLKRGMTYAEIVEILF